MDKNKKIELDDKLTPQQKETIINRGKNLLVSASAGSGKTFVMIQRIINMIKNKEVSVEDLLVVTFTKSAAGEMKERLIKGLEDVEPKDDFIKEQLLLVASSSISTLHSFCAKLLKTYFYAIGLDPSFILIDEIEANALKAKALTKLIDSRFVLKDEMFFELLDIFSINRKEENFKAIILKLYEYMLTETRGEEWFNNCLQEAYNPDINTNKCACIVSNYIANQVDKLKQSADELLTELSVFGAEKLIEVVNSIYVNLLKIKSGASYLENLNGLKSFEKVKDMPRKLPEEQAVLKQKVKDFKDKYNEVKALAEKELDEDYAENFDKKMQINKKRIKALYDYTAIFKNIYQDLKKEKVALDFSDLEEYTLKLLDISEIRESVQEKYKYVFIDEYQDTNMVQEEIVRKITRKNNLFMVGDVKQSIYKFRASEPGIFVGKYRQYLSGEDDFNKAINLNHNFRSHQDILNFANLIFKLNMTQEFGQVDYLKDAMLVKGDKPYPKVSDFPVVKLDLYEKVQKEKGDEVLQLEDYSVKQHKNVDTSSIKKAEKEGFIIANNIKELVGKEIYVAKEKTTRRINYSDIAILTASRGEYLEIVLKALASANIPYTSDVSVSVFDDNHMSVIKSVLSLTYNMFDDVNLLCVLNSSMFDFSINDLAKIRAEFGEEKFFYEALSKVRYSKDFGDKKLYAKVCEFYNKIELFNYLSKFMEVDCLIDKILAETNYYNKILGSENGERSIVILNKLLAFLSGKSYNVNLCKFLDYIKENVLEFQLDSSGGGVSVTTIHKSKGLEYPVVILMGVGQDMLKRNTGEFVVGKNIGFGIDYYDIVKRTKQKSIVKNAIKLENTRADKEEKLRLLYVALTRAVNHLVVVGEAKPELTIGASEDANTFFDWIMPAINYYKEGKNDKSIDISCNITKNVEPYKEDKREGKVDFSISACKEDFIQTIKDYLLYKYPYLSMVDMPVKTSVSEIMQESEGEYKIPNAFVDSLESTEAIKRGLAYHKLMQLISLKVRTKESLEENINFLIKRGKISIEEVNRVNLDSVLKLLTNPKFAKYTTYDILREQEFIALTNVSETKKKNDSVILQGVVDIIVVTPEGIIIGDYKTNNYKNEAKFVEKYKKQLDIYASVVEENFGIKVIEKFIYSFNLNKFIAV